MNIENTMMACGHSANATNEFGDPCCAICMCINPGAETIVTTPNLENRIAKCTYCKTQQPSSIKLAFFTYKGPGSKHAKEVCKNCGFYEVAHPRHNCTNFVAIGDSLDEFYCGCRGWD